MFDWLPDLAKTAPGIVAAVILVYLFMQYLKKRDDSDKEMEKLRQGTIERIGDNCHKAQAVNTEIVKTCMERSNEVIVENSRALGKMEEALTRINGRR